MGAKPPPKPVGLRPKGPCGPQANRPTVMLSPAGLGPYGPFGPAVHNREGKAFSITKGHRPLGLSPQGLAYGMHVALGQGPYGPTSPKGKGPPAPYLRVKPRAIGPYGP